MPVFVCIINLYFYKDILTAGALYYAGIKIPPTMDFATNPNIVWKQNSSTNVGLALTVNGVTENFTAQFIGGQWH